MREDAKAGSRGEKGELATITYNFHFHQDCLSSLYRRGHEEFIYLLNRFCNSFSLHQSQTFLTTEMFFFPSTGHETSTCPLREVLNTLILVLFTLERSSSFRRLSTPWQSATLYNIVHSGIGEQRFPGLCSLMFYSSCFLPFASSFLTVNS